MDPRTARIEKIEQRRAKKKQRAADLRRAALAQTTADPERLAKRFGLHIRNVTSELKDHGIVIDGDRWVET